MGVMLNYLYIYQAALRLLVTDSGSHISLRLTPSMKFCDKFLVQTDIFTILGVSFCVMQNSLNSNKIKN